MNRQEYNTCISKGLKGKQFTKEQRRMEFCIIAKLCSGKLRTRDEAMAICSQPKAPKLAKVRVGRSTQSCEKDVLSLSRCMAERINMDQASNINTVEMAMANALMECKCPR